MFSTPFTFLKQVSGGGGGTDPDAEAYLAAVVSAGGTTDSTIESAVNDLFVSLKSASLYSLMNAFYPVVGGVAASHALNGNLNSSYDLTFNGTFTHSADGFVATATSDYASTGYVPLTVHPDNAMTMGIYTNTVGSTGTSFRHIMGADSGISRYMYWFYSTIGSTYRMQALYCDNTTGTIIDESAAADWLGVIQLGSNGTTKYFSKTTGGVETAVSAAKDGNDIPAVELYIGNTNSNGSALNGQLARIAFAYMSEDLTPAQMTTLAGIIETYETALSR